MAPAGGADGPDGIHTDVHSRVEPQRHLRVAEVVVDGGRNADAGDAQRAEPLRALEASVSSQNNQSVDLHIGKRPYRQLLIIGIQELQTAGRAQVSARLVGYIQNRVQMQFLQVVLYIRAFSQQTVVAPLDSDQRDPVHVGAAGDGRNGRVHAGAVAAAG